MKQEVREKWVAALRSGRYKQGRGRLRQDNSFCCLGVLCEVLEIPADPLDEVKDGHEGVIYAYEFQTAYLPPKARELSGLVGGMPEVRIDRRKESLGHLNDLEFKSFIALADIIEEQADDWNGAIDD